MSGLTSKALFLDRDGVINVERCYVYRRDDFLFQEGIFDLCRAAQCLGYLLVVVTNQAGIARGFYTEADFLALTEWMIEKFARYGSTIARVYYCPYHPIHGVGRYKKDSADRKPKPGMLLRARRDFNLDLTSSVLIGDKLSDIEAAKAAGIGTTILLRLGAPESSAGDSDFHVAGSLHGVCSNFFSGSHDAAKPTEISSATLSESGGCHVGATKSASEIGLVKVPPSSTIPTRSHDFVHLLPDCKR